MSERLRVERDCDIDGKPDAVRVELLVHGEQVSVDLCDLAAHSVADALAAGKIASVSAIETPQPPAPGRRSASDWVRLNTRPAPSGPQTKEKGAPGLSVQTPPLDGSEST